jgi:multiple sugar transport system substrate-binding protein
MTEHPQPTARVLSRRALLKSGALAGLGVLGIPLLAACQQSATPASQPAEKQAEKPAAKAAPAEQKGGAPAAQAKPYAGKSITVWMTSHVFGRALRDLIPQFEEQSGIKVAQELLSFDIHNQRADLELSSGSGSVDVMNLTFIFAGKWIEAGWCTDLTPLLGDAQMTRPGEVEVEDFIGGAIEPFKRGDKVFGLPWVAETTLLMYRTDVFKDKGIAGPPKTFEEMVDIAKKVHSGEVAGNLTRGTNGLHWVWPTYLYG